MWPPWLRWSLLLATLVPSGAEQVAPCGFNSMCSCKDDGGGGGGGGSGGGGGAGPLTPTTLPAGGGDARPLRDVTCLGVPFSRLPRLPSGSVVEHMDVVNSGLEAVEADSLEVHIESLRLMSNRIQYVAPRAFAWMKDTLRSLDLSYNQLDEVPFEALQLLSGLDWLNLHSNQIASLDGPGSDWVRVCENLTNLFLGENELAELPVKYPGNGLNGNGVNGAVSSLRDCGKLTWLNVDSNRLRALEAGALPPSLQTLSASHNLLSSFPSAAVDALPGLSWLYLRDNYIADLPAVALRPRSHRLEQLDLGDNGVHAIPETLFNGSLQVRDLHLDYNYLTGLPAQVFRGTNAVRIYLSMNRLRTRNVDPRAFVGVGHTLEALDLEHNQLDEVPRALSQLKRLKYLYLPSNNVSDVADDAFESFCSTLRVLSLEDNQLTRIPSGALQNCLHLLHLNVGYNRIDEVRPSDLEGWAGSLDTLLLRNNRIASLSEFTFVHAPHLRELSLSFNKLGHVHPDAFTDLADSLESLEMSFGLDREDFPADFLKPLKALSWLALDNNDLRTVQETDLYTLTKLQYLNLESNRLRCIPPGFFHQKVHANLRDVRLSHNELKTLETDTFWGLPQLQTLVLTGNRLHALAQGALRALPSLVTLLLADNRLDALAPGALSRLPALSRLDLQNNRLHELSLAAFLNVTTPETPMALNLSYNVITVLHPAYSEIHVRILDLSHNLLPEVPVNFLQRMSSSLRRLYLGYNLLSGLEARALGPLPHLQELSLPHNRILSLAAQAFAGAGGSLQLLDLSHNHVETLQLRQFHGLPRLRVLDLSHNHIRSVPRDAFRGTQLERLDLSHNQLVVMPSGALAEVGSTLRRLRLSHNQLEHLDSSMFPETAHLVALFLGHNRLTILPDNVFSGIDGLLELNLANNSLRANFKELFHYVQRLRTLSLAHTGLEELPSLPLPHLLRLNLSENSIGKDERDAHLDAASARDLTRLRQLSLSGNHLSSVPSRIWPMMPLVKNIDLTRNPIKVVTRESFSHLTRLTTLNVEDLPYMERFDADSLTGLPLLTKLRIQTWPRIEKYRFRVGSALSSVWSLRELSVRVLEPALSDQLLGAFSNAKLRRLELSGCTLRSVAPDALEGLADSSHELQLRVRDTGLEELPPGLVAGLATHVPHLALDLRDNRFRSLSPSDLYPNGSSWESVGTRPFAGGLLLSGNQLTCDCGLVWLGHWLRRWLRESLQIHTVVVEGAQEMAAAARRATCRDASNREVALLQLRAPDPSVACHPSALSQGGAAPRAGRLAPLLHAACLLIATRWIAGV